MRAWMSSLWGWGRYCVVESIWALSPVCVGNKEDPSSPDLRRSPPDYWGLSFNGWSRRRRICEFDSDESPTYTAPISDAMRERASAPR